MDRISSIDGMKAIAAFLVVLIHQRLPGIMGEIVIPLARIAVPFFFIVSGFLLYSNDKEKLSGKIRRKIYNIIRIVILSTLLYLVWEIFQSLMQGIGLKEYFYQNISFIKIAKVILLNDIQIGSHLWYLYALVYVLIFYYFVNVYNLENIVYKLIPFLLVVDLVFGKYSVALFNIEIPFIFVRNFMFVGIPYFMLGNFIRKIHDKNNMSINNRLLIWGIIIFSITTLLEKYILINNNMNAVRDHYISTTLLVVVVFIYLLKNKYIFSKTIIEKIGYKYSLSIYIIHPIVIGILNYLFIHYLNLGIIYDYLAPFIVYFISIVIAICYNKIKTYILNSKNGRTRPIY